MGKKYVIELEDVPFVNDLTLLNERLYRVKGFKSLVFDENGLEKLTPIDDVLREAERKGQNEAWEFIRLSDEDLKEIFPEASGTVRRLCRDLRPSGTLVPHKRACPLGDPSHLCSGAS